MVQDNINLIYWDMDGTLIDTGTAGRRAIEEIFKRNGKAVVPHIKISESGKTDTYICWHFYIALFSKVPSKKELMAFCEVYEMEIVRQMKMMNASLLSNVQNILQDLQKRDDWVCLLISGNRKNGVVRKLKLLGIDQYFNIEDSVFGDEYLTKRTMAKDALAYSESRWGKECKRIVVGDAPMDIVCGDIMGATTVSVATGAYNSAKLATFKPTIVYERLPSSNEFVAEVKKALV